jgi:hypothetical protein
MALGPTTSEAAQNLTRRLQRFVDALERVRRPPNRREAYHALVALEYLQAGQYEQGDEAMQRVEHLTALPPEVAIQRGPQDAMTTLKLRGLLDGIVAGQR